MQIAEDAEERKIESPSAFSAANPSHPIGRCSAWKFRVIKRAPLLKVT